MESCRVDFAVLPWVTPAKNVRYKIHKHGDRQLRLVEFANGFVETDWCRKGHIGYVLEGRGELAYENHTVAFEPGNGFFIPAGEDHKHKLHVLTEVIRVVLVEDA